jgi:hypothetical protein
LFTFPFMDPLGPDPLIRSFERHLYAENRSARTVTTYLIAVRQADTFLRERGTSLEAATRGDLEAFLGDLLARRKASTAATYHKVLKILYGWLRRALDPHAEGPQPVVPTLHREGCLTRKVACRSRRRGRLATARLAGGQEGADLVAFRGSDAGEQGVGVPPGSLGGLVAGVVEGVAEDQQRACLAEPVAGRALDVGGLTGVDGGLGAVGSGEVEVGEDGQRLPLQNPVAGSPGLGERLLRAGSGALELAEVTVGGGQAEQRHDLGMADADLARQAERVPGMAQGSLRVAEAALARGQGVAGQRLAVVVVDVTGQREGRSGEVEGLGVAAGFTTDGGETAEAERFSISVPRPPKKDQGLAELLAGVVETAQLAKGRGEVPLRGRLAGPRADLVVGSQRLDLVIHSLLQPSELRI